MRSSLAGRSDVLLFTRLLQTDISASSSDRYRSVGQMISAKCQKIKLKHFLTFLFYWRDCRFARRVMDQRCDCLMISALASSARLASVQADWQDVLTHVLSRAGLVTGKLIIISITHPLSVFKLTIFFTSELARCGSSEQRQLALIYNPSLGCLQDPEWSKNL